MDIAFCRKIMESKWMDNLLCDEEGRLPDIPAIIYINGTLQIATAFNAQHMRYPMRVFSSL